METEVEGADAHELAHRAAHGDALTVKIAVMTVLMAMVAVVISVFEEEVVHVSEELRWEAAHLRSNAGESRTKAADTWAHYQAKSIKATVSELGAGTAYDRQSRDKFAADAVRYNREKDKLLADARALDAEADKENSLADGLDKDADDTLAPRSKLKYGLPLIQVGIAIASITALTRVRWMLWVAYAVALVGVLIVWFALNFNVKLGLHEELHDNPQAAISHE